MSLRRLWWLAAVLIGVAVVSLVVFIFGWFMTGGRVYAIQTNSMQPVFRAGDVVLTRPLSYEQLRVGQIVSSSDASIPSVITTHRVVAVDRHMRNFTSKGDNVDQADLPLAASQLKGRAVMVAPGLGSWLERLRRPPVLIALFYIPITILIALSLNRLWRPRLIYRGR